VVVVVVVVVVVIVVVVAVAVAGVKVVVVVVVVVAAAAAIFFSKFYTIFDIVFILHPLVCILLLQHGTIATSRNPLYQ